MTLDESIRQLETEFWQALVDQDEKAASDMIAENCVIIGPSGASRIDPETYRTMMEDDNWRLDSFQFFDVQVIHPAQDTAIIAYQVRQKGQFKGNPMDMTCADSTAWVKEGDAWRCALHTETILEGS